MIKLNIDFRKRELENNLLLPKKSITTAIMSVEPGKEEGYIEFNVKISLNEYSQLSKKNVTMLNAYKYRKR